MFSTWKLYLKGCLSGLFIHQRTQLPGHSLWFQWPPYRYIFERLNQYHFIHLLVKKNLIILPLASHKINRRHMALLMHLYHLIVNFIVMDTVSVRNVQLYTTYYVIKNKNYFPWVFPQTSQTSLAKKDCCK